MTPPTPLSEIEAVLAKATPGPWEHAPEEVPCGPEFDNTPCPASVCVKDGDPLFWVEEGYCNVGQAEANATLIVLLRNLAPALLTELRRLGEVERKAVAVFNAATQLDQHDALRALRAALGGKGGA